MARGSGTIVTSDPKGLFDEGYVNVGQTFYPGMVVQRDASQPLRGGRWTYKYYDRAVDGDQPLGAFWVVTHLLQALMGGTATGAIAAGERVVLYSPMAGEELNLLVGNVDGTGDDHALNEILMVDDGTGKLVATLNTPETEVAQLLEVITDPTTDTLAWCQWSGH